MNCTILHTHGATDICMYGKIKNADDTEMLPFDLCKLRDAQRGPQLCGPHFPIPPQLTSTLPPLPRLLLCLPRCWGRTSLSPCPVPPSWHPSHPLLCPTLQNWRGVAKQLGMGAVSHSFCPRWLDRRNGRSSPCGALHLL